MSCRVNRNARFSGDIPFVFVLVKMLLLFGGQRLTTPN